MYGMSSASYGSMSFAALLFLLGLHPAGGDAVAAAAAQTQEDGRIEFKKADVDVSGQLSENEFLDWWSQHKKTGEIFDFHARGDPNGEKIPGNFREGVKQTEAKTLNFWEAFVNSLAMIIVTELGDKTFFIAAILSMRHGPIVIFAGAMTALAIMTVLGVGVGFVLPTLLPRTYTHIAATLLFVYFGLKLLREGYELWKKGEGDGPNDELEEVEKELDDKGPGQEEDESNEAGLPRKDVRKDNKKANKMQAIYWQALTLTFIAEWGDRSQIATIALAAAKDPLGVIVGGCIGHSLCTGLACAGGKVIAGRISERNMLIIGGILFLAFAVHSFIAGPAE